MGFLQFLLLKTTCILCALSKLKYFGNFFVLVISLIPLVGFSSFFKFGLVERTQLKKVDIALSLLSLVFVFLVLASFS